MTSVMFLVGLYQVGLMLQVKILSFRTMNVAFPQVGHILIFTIGEQDISREQYTTRVKWTVGVCWCLIKIKTNYGFPRTTSSMSLIFARALNLHALIMH